MDYKRIDLFQIIVLEDGVLFMFKDHKNKDNILYIITNFIEAGVVFSSLNKLEVRKENSIVKNLINSLNLTIKYFHIYDYKNDQYKCRAVISSIDRNAPFIIECPVYEAIALSFEMSIPLIVDDTLFTKIKYQDIFDSKNKIVYENDDSDDESVTLKKRNLKPNFNEIINLLKRKMDDAIINERYEEAAKLRDNISSIERGYNGK